MCSPKLADIETYHSGKIDNNGCCYSVWLVLIMTLEARLCRTLVPQSGTGFTVLLTAHFIYLSFFFPPAMFLPFPSSSRRSPACLQKMRIWSFPFSMFCVHLPRLLLNCMTKHSPTSTKVSVLRNLFVVGNELTAAKNKNHWHVIQFFCLVLL